MIDFDRLVNFDRLFAFSALTLLVGWQEVRPVTTEWWAVGMVICLERGADLHMAHLMPLSLALVKSWLALPFWYRLTWVVLEKGPLNGCVCICMVKNYLLFVSFCSSSGHVAADNCCYARYWEHTAATAGPAGPVIHSASCCCCATAGHQCHTAAAWHDRCPADHVSIAVATRHTRRSAPHSGGSTADHLGSPAESGLTALQIGIWVMCVPTGGSVAEWLACWTQVQKGPDSNRSRDAVG